MNVHLSTDIVRRSFFNTSLSEIYRAIDGRCLTGAFTLILCSLDALTNLEPDIKEGNFCSACGQLTDKTIKTCGECSKPVFSMDLGKSFRNWCKRWLVTELKLRDCDPQFLYELRCSLVHAHGLGKGLSSRTGFQLPFDLPSEHWQKISLPAPLQDDSLRAGYVLNLDSLLSELVLAAWRFFKHMEIQWGDDQNIIGTRLFSLIGVAATDLSGRFHQFHQPPTLYSKMHPALAIFDDAEEPSLSRIRYHIHESYKRYPRVCKCNSVYQYVAEERRRTEQLNKFDFVKLAGFGATLYKVLDEVEFDDEASKSVFLSGLRALGKSSKTVLINFPSLEFDYPDFPKDFIQELHGLAFDNSKIAFEDLFDKVNDYNDHFVKALEEMLRDAVSLGLMDQFTSDDFLQSMGITIRSSH